MKTEDNIKTYKCQACKLCGTYGRPLYQGLKDRLFGVSGTWNLRQCSKPNCGLVWLDPMPIEEDIGSLYANYFTHVPDSPVKIRKNFKRRLKESTLAFAFGYPEQMPNRWIRLVGRLLAKSRFVNERLGRSIMWVKANLQGRLLDIGCGNGRFLAQMQDLGWNCVGFEPDHVAAQVAREQYGLEVYNGVLEDTDLKPNTFDVITMSHVIEHLPNPSRTLKICNQLLKKNGLVVIATPNISSLGHRIFQSSWIHLDPPRHLILFSITALRNYLRSAGFEIKKTWTSANSAPGMWARSRLIKKKGVCRFDLSDLPSRYTKVEGNLFLGVEHIATKIFPLGEELVLIANKK